MAPPSSDASTLPRRSARATAALILGFLTLAGLSIVSHLDRGESASDAPGFEQQVDLPEAVPADTPISGIVVVQRAPGAANNGDEVGDNARDSADAGDRSGASVHLVAPLAWKQALAPGSAFKFHVDQTGHHHQGHVLALDDKVDPAQRTVRVIGTLHDDDASLRPGMSGSARFDERVPAPARR